jgi:transposase
MKPVTKELGAELAHAPGLANEVALRYNVSLCTVLRWRRKCGIGCLNIRNEKVASRAIKLRREGATLKEVASKTRRSLATVWKWCKGEPKPPRKPSPRIARAMAKALQMRRDGKTLAEIHAVIGFAKPTIWYWCENARVSRGKNEANKPAAPWVTKVLAGMNK